MSVTRIREPGSAELAADGTAGGSMLIRFGMRPGELRRACAASRKDCVSGVKSFMVSRDADLYEGDLGRHTAQAGEKSENSIRAMVGRR
jgi:hypothetical protein